MRVLIVGPSNRFQSGISTYTLRLANALDEAGHEVSVIAFRKLLPRFLFPGGKRVGQNLSVLKFNDRVRVFDEMDYNDPITWRRARKFVRDERPDAIILQWWTSSAAHMHLQVKREAEKLGIPVYVEMHEVIDTLEQKIWPIAKYARIMGPKVVRDAAGYITHSESDKRLLCEAYGMAAEKIAVIPHGNYDHYGDLYAKDDAKAILKIEEPYVFLYFGLIREYKGVPTLIEAFENLPVEQREKTRLLLVGEVWEQKDEVYARIDRSSAKDKITLVDKYVPDGEVAKYFSAADTVVLPYTRASQSGVAHIAISYGKPLIVSRVGGLAESLADYAGCTFVEPEDAAALAGALVESAATRTLTVQAPEKSSWASVVGQYNGVLVRRR